MIECRTEWNFRPKSKFREGVIAGNMNIIEKIFGTHSENELKRIYPIVDRIEALGPGDGGAFRRRTSRKDKRI